MITGSTHIEISGSASVDPSKIVQNLERCGQGAEGLVDRYATQRRQRVRGANHHAQTGHVIDAAMDALQFSSPGSMVADGARALGLVQGDVEQHALAAIFNGLFGGPLGKVAALGDAEDALQAALSQWGKRGTELETLGQLPAGRKRRCAPSQHVPSPSQRLSQGRPARGFKASAGLQVRAGGLGELSLQARAAAHFEHGFLGAFLRDLPRLRVSLTGRTRSGSASGPHRPSSDQSEIGRILDDPNLSFEDKLFYVMCQVAKNQEEKMEQLIARYDEAAKRKKDEEKRDKQLGQMASIASFGGTAALTAMGVPPPFSSMIADAVSKLGVDGAKQLFEGLQFASDATKPDEGKGSGTKLTEEQKEWSEKRWMMELERANQELTQVYGLISNLQKSNHDTQMAAIRNIR